MTSLSIAAVAVAGAYVAACWVAVSLALRTGHVRRAISRGLNFAVTAAMVAGGGVGTFLVLFGWPSNEASASAWQDVAIPILAALTACLWCATITTSARARFGAR